MLLIALLQEEILQTASVVWPAYDEALPSCGIRIEYLPSLVRPLP